jgi:methylase of polypeptide subunit release factors
LTQSISHQKYGAIDVAYIPELDGGGLTFGQQFIPVVRTLFGHVDHVFEFCSGPGFIGFSLLSHGLCDRLTLADVNPAAVEVCKLTIAQNSLEDKCRVFLSDGLDSIPAGPSFDLVVGNPPHFPVSKGEEKNLLRDDIALALHKRFYKDIPPYLKPEGTILLQENEWANSENDFRLMIENDGRLQVMDVFKAISDSRFYFMMSRLVR